MQILYHKFAYGKIVPRRISAPLVVWRPRHRNTAADHIANIMMHEEDDEKIWRNRTFPKEDIRYLQLHSDGGHTPQQTTIGVTVTAWRINEFGEWSSIFIAIIGRRIRTSNSFAAEVAALCEAIQWASKEFA